MKRGFRVRSLLVTAVVGIAACGGTDGKDGKSCTVKSIDAGVSVLSCPDGTQVTLGGTATLPALDGGATSTAGCTVVSNGDRTSTLTCPGLDGGVVTTTVRNALVDFTALGADGLSALDLKAEIQGIAIPASGKPAIAFRVLDNASGNVVKGIPATDMRFALLKLVPATTGGNDTWVSYMAANATSTPTMETAAATASATSGALVDNADGSYVYTFAKNITDSANAGTTYDATATHRFAMRIAQSANGLQVFAPLNVVKDFVPATGADVTGQNDKVDGASCLECHSSFRAKAGGTGAFHGGANYDVGFCVVCHNDQQRYQAIPGTGATPNVDLDATGVVDTTTAHAWTGNALLINGEAFPNLPVWIHKIHMADQLTLTGGTYTGIAKPYDITYPQDVGNCAKCHRSPAAMAATFATKPSRRACGSCHDNISFLATPPAGRVAHAGGAQADDSKCAGCHPVTGAKTQVSFGVIDSHVTVASPDTTGAPEFGGTNTHTNAGWIPAAGKLPTGAAKISYKVAAVVRDANKHPSITFQFTKDGAAVVFNTYAAGSVTELMDNFVGSPSVYFAYALPQDGITAPADFNASASGWLKSIWNGTATGASGGTMTGPDANGNYTVTLNATVPDSAVMLTGGIGYTYGSSTPPLTQINLAAFPYGDSTVVTGCATGQKCGGLIVAATDVSMVATDATSGKAYATRRAIVSNTTCLKCHAQLGATPTFHAGQRNDAGTCNWCHNPNRTNGGWSVDSSSFIHAIHGASKRTQTFSYNASCPTGTSFAAGTCTLDNADNYGNVTYPGILNNCQQCHLANMYDFSSTAYTDTVLANMLMSTVATGTYTAGITISPYVKSDGTDYGTNFSTSNLTSGTKDGTACTTTAPCVCTAAAPCDASATTLVKSPITAACSGCHDSANEIAHMQQMGGTFYGTRKAALAQSEMCLMCHGPDGIAAIAKVHQ